MILTTLTIIRISLLVVVLIVLEAEAAACRSLYRECRMARDLALARRARAEASRTDDPEDRAYLLEMAEDFEAAARGGAR